MNLSSDKIQELLRHFRSVTVIQHDPDIESATLGQAMLIIVGIPDLDVARTDEGGGSVFRIKLSVANFE
jgi:hypothetical protein